MNMTVLKLGISVFISVIGIYICFSVLTSEIKSSKSITMAGTENSYWSKNKSRSAEAKKDRNYEDCGSIIFGCCNFCKFTILENKKSGDQPTFSL